jgi:leader peptidase (prepilin peptidase)/N-methyltransferase
MILAFALLGLVTGWLINLLGDYLLRFRGEQAAHAVEVPRLPAILRRFSRQPYEQHHLIHLASELVTAILFALLYALHGSSWQTLGLMAVCAYFVLITVIDFKYRLVLNILTYPGIVLALLLNIVVFRSPVLNILLGVLFAFGIFYVTSLVRPNGLGGGDIKLAALIGATFGFPQVLWALIASAVVSAVIILYLLISHQRTTRDSIPYAPFLCVGAVVALILTSTLIR